MLRFACSIQLDNRSAFILVLRKTRLNTFMYVFHHKFLPKMQLKFRYDKNSQLKFTKSSLVREGLTKIPGEPEHTASSYIYMDSMCYNYNKGCLTMFYWNKFVRKRIWWRWKISKCLKNLEFRFLSKFCGWVT